MERWRWWEDRRATLDWDGSFNVRDLGGLRTTDDRKKRWGAVVRADALDGLTVAGWVALCAHGVRTVIDLRNDDQRGPDFAPRLAAVRTVRTPPAARKTATSRGHARS